VSHVHEKNIRRVNADADLDFQLLIVRFRYGQRKGLFIPILHMVFLTDVLLAKRDFYGEPDSPLKLMPIICWLDYNIIKTRKIV